MDLFPKLKQEITQEDRLGIAFFLSLSLFIFLNPFPRITTIKEVLYYSSVIMGAFSLVERRKKIFLRTPLVAPFILFILWSFLTSLLAVEKAASLYTFYNHLLEYVVLYCLIVEGFGSKNKLQFLAVLFLASATIFAAGALSYFYLWEGNQLTVRFGGGFANSAINVMGYATVPAMLLAGYFSVFQQDVRVRVILFVSLMLTAAASILTQSRGTILAMFVGFLVLFFRHKKVLIVFLLFLGLVIGINTPIKNRFDLESISSEARVALAGYAWEVIKDYPVFGVGYAVETAFKSDGIFPQESYRKKLPLQRQESIKFMDLLLPHNMLLNFAVRVGVPGVLFFLGIFTVFVRMCINLVWRGKDPFIRGWAHCTLALFSTFFVKGLFEPITTHFVEVIYFSFLAMGTILWRLDQEARGDVLGMGQYKGRPIMVNYRGRFGFLSRCYW